MQLTSVDLRFSHDGRAAHLRLPGGALEGDVCRQLAAAAESLIDDRAVAVVTIAALDSDFCTGPAEDLDVYGFRPDPVSALARIRVPVIAAINGACQGEGLELILAADIRLGTPNSTYALDHIIRGRVPAWGGTQRLPRCVGTGAATAMTLLGQPVDAMRAQSLGLLHAVTEPGATESLDAARDRLVDVLLTRGPLALELAKEAVHRGSELPLRDGLRLEGDLNHQLAATEDRAEGLQAFFEKRPPDFSGR